MSLTWCTSVGHLSIMLKHFFFLCSGYKNWILHKRLIPPRQVITHMNTPMEKSWDARWASVSFLQWNANCEDQTTNLYIRRPSSSLLRRSHRSLRIVHIIDRDLSSSRCACCQSYTIFQSPCVNICAMPVKTQAWSQSCRPTYRNVKSLEDD